MRTLADLFTALDAQLTAETRSQIRSLDHKSLWKMQSGVSALIKGIAYMRNPSEEGRSYFLRLGSPDAVCDALGELYWRHLNSLSFDVASLAGVLERHGCATPHRLTALSCDLSRSYLEFRSRCFAAVPA